MTLHPSGLKKVEVKIK